MFVVKIVEEQKLEQFILCPYLKFKEMKDKGPETNTGNILMYEVNMDIFIILTYVSMSCRTRLVK